MDPETIAAELSGLAREIAEQSRAQQPEPLGEGWWRPLEEQEGYQHNLSHHAERLVGRLAETLARAGWESGASVEAPPKGARWTFGEWTQRAPIREIHHGFLEPLRRRPLVARVPEPVVLYLIHELPGGDDSLKREHHPGVGWHYHYLDRRKGRSNVILCWDTRWTLPTPTPRAAVVRPLFSEIHGEGNADFRARPDLWGDTKRRSMHEACRGDLKRDIREFRPASNDADPVWPPHGRPTPISAKPVSSGGRALKDKKRR